MFAKAKAAAQKDDSSDSQPLRVLSPLMLLAPPSWRPRRPSAADKGEAFFLLDDEDDVDTAAFLALDVAGRVRHLESLPVDARLSAPFGAHAACLLALPSAADRAACLLRLPTATAAAVLVELRLRGDFGNVLGAMGRGGGAAMEQELGSGAHAGLSRAVKGMPIDVGLKLVDCADAAGAGKLLEGLKLAHATGIVLELHRRGAAGLVLTAVAASKPAAAAAIVSQAPSANREALLSAIDEAVRNDVAARIAAAPEESAAHAAERPTAANRSSSGGATVAAVSQRLSEWRAAVESVSPTHVAFAAAATRARIGASAAQQAAAASHPRYYVKRAMGDLEARGGGSGEAVSERLEAEACPPPVAAMEQDPSGAFWRFMGLTFPEHTQQAPGSAARATVGGGVAASTKGRHGTPLDQAPAKRPTAGAEAASTPRRTIAAASRGASAARGGAASSFSSAAPPSSPASAADAAGASPQQARLPPALVASLGRRNLDGSRYLSPSAAAARKPKLPGLVAGPSAASSSSSSSSSSSLSSSSSAAAALAAAVAPPQQARLPPALVMDLRRRNLDGSRYLSPSAAAASAPRPPACAPSSELAAPNAPRWPGAPAAPHAGSFTAPPPGGSLSSLAAPPAESNGGSVETAAAAAAAARSAKTPSPTRLPPALLANPAARLNLDGSRYKPGKDKTPPRLRLTTSTRTAQATPATPATPATHEWPRPERDARGSTLDRPPAAQPSSPPRPRRLPPPSHDDGKATSL